jgi:GTPase SAR1 family protein
MRICLYGAAGCGKSTTAARLFVDLRLREFEPRPIIELVTEVIKPWAYMKREVRSFDQVHIFGQQLHNEDFLFQHGVNHIVTDSPLHLQCFYTRLYRKEFWQDLLSISNKWEISHQSLNIFLDGSNIPYEEEGRYQTKPEADAIGRDMQKFLNEHLPASYQVFDTTDYETIKGYVLAHLGGARK